MINYTITQPQKMINDNLIVKHLSGSKSYGTDIPESDTDYRGIFYANKINIVTPFFPIKEVIDFDEEDTKLYELTHFLKLCVDCNPNIVESLWVDPSHIIFKDSKGIYKKLIKYRSDFLSTKIAHTYSGYAFAQLKRIKGHNKWITNPQSINPPRQIDFISLVQNFTDKKIFKFNLEELEKSSVSYRIIHLGSQINGIYESPGYSLYDKDFTLNNSVYDSNSGFLENNIPKYLVKYNKVEYNLALEKWKQYWEWKKNRNEKRSTLEEQFGYDTKHAMHLIRLLRTGYEVLTTGNINVYRKDHDELLAIRNGSMTYEEIINYADDMDKKIKKVYNNSVLPKKVDKIKVANILIEIQDLCWS